MAKVFVAIKRKCDRCGAEDEGRDIGGTTTYASIAGWMVGFTVPASLTPGERAGLQHQDLCPTCTGELAEWIAGARPPSRVVDLADAVAGLDPDDMRDLLITLVDAIAGQVESAAIDTEEEETS